jgi:hypothetical protein
MYHETWSSTTNIVKNILSVKSLNHSIKSFVNVLLGDNDPCHRKHGLTINLNIGDPKHHNINLNHSTFFGQNQIYLYMHTNFHINIWILKIWYMGLNWIPFISFVSRHTHPLNDYFICLRLNLKLSMLTFVSSLGASSLV